MRMKALHGWRLSSSLFLTQTTRGRIFPLYSRSYATQVTDNQVSEDNYFPSGTQRHRHAQRHSPPLTTHTTQSRSSPVAQSDAVAHGRSLEPPQVEVTDYEVLLHFNTNPTAPTTHHLPNFWLRDHCQCTECTHPSTKQRQINTFGMQSDVAIDSFDTSAADGLRINWAAPNQHTSIFPWVWLLRHSPFQPIPTASTLNFLDPQEPNTWPRVDYNSIMTSDKGLHDYIRAIHDFGLCFAPKTPATPEATQNLIERISHIRPTHYGGFWDFTSVVNPTDTAYTTLPLTAHTDTTYFTDPCGLQMFHLLSHTDSNKKTQQNFQPNLGGESIFVDGFAAAQHLYTTDPTSYHALSTVNVVSHASGDRKAGSIRNDAARSGYPVLNHRQPDTTTSAHRPNGSDDDHFHPANLTQVRWNNDDRSPLTRFANRSEMERWYAAARKWAGILRDPCFEMVEPLRPGEPVVFDNWRVLHGRRAFTGHRRMCGAYVGMDDFRARLRALEDAEI